MTVAGRIATGTALLLVLLLALAAYHLRTVSKLTAANQELATEGSRLVVEGLEVNRLVALLDDSVRKLAATGDARYAERAAQTRPAFDKTLLLVATLARDSDQERLAEALQGSWRRFGRSVPDDAALRAAADADERERLLADPLNEIATLRSASQRLVDAAYASLLARVDHLAEERARSERVAWTVFAVALALGLLTSLVTIRSIQRSLRRLTEATRQVSEENYLHQVETRRGDEFSRLAVAFNDMVRRLGELDVMKRNLLSEVSHELKTPLANMEECHRLLLDGIPGPLQPEQRRVLELAGRSGRRLSRLISNLLERARFSAGAVELHLEEVAIGSLATAVVEEFAAHAAARGVLLECEIAVAGVEVRCDQERMAQVFRNLIDNAIKSSPRGARIVLRCELATTIPLDLPERWRAAWREVARYLIVEVVDEGIGVAPEERERIFRRFHRVGGRVRPSHGIGLGLAICREVIQAHRGAIWVSPNVPVGSRFRLLLPLDPAEPADDSATLRATG